MSEIGVALIGLGMWGQRLAAAVRRTPSLRLITCFSRNEAQRQAFAANFGCEPASSFETAIEHPQVKGVLLVTPNYLHASKLLPAPSVAGTFLSKNPSPIPWPMAGPSGRPAIRRG
jgi:predicted dehydrogenase